MVWEEREVEEREERGRGVRGRDGVGREKWRGKRENGECRSGKSELENENERDGERMKRRKRWMAEWMEERGQGGGLRLWTGRAEKRERRHREGLQLERMIIKSCVSRAPKTLARLL